MGLKNNNEPLDNQKEEESKLPYVDCRGCEIDWEKSHE